MKIVVLGGTGNVGTSVIGALSQDPQIDEIVSVARRQPAHSFPRTSFQAADVARDELTPIFRGADAVIHLAWLIQPGRDERITRAVNVDGSERVFRSVVEAGVPALIYASSVGTYSPGPKDRAVDEGHPREGIVTSFYSRHKAEVERLLDVLEGEHPELRVVRLRPGLIFKREAATEIRRLFAGPFLPRALVHPRLIPVVPDIPRLRFQAVHTDDVGEAYRLAAVGEARGAFNIAADPVLDSSKLAEALGARPVPVPAGVLRAGASVTYALRLQPTEPGWLDMALAVPILDCSRARDELGWVPRRTSVEALLELIDGMHSGADFDTPPLSRTTSGPLRSHELATGVGARP